MNNILMPWTTFFWRLVKHIRNDLSSSYGVRFSTPDISVRKNFSWANPTFFRYSVLANMLCFLETPCSCCHYKNSSLFLIIVKITSHKEKAKWRFLIFLEYLENAKRYWIFAFDISLDIGLSNFCLIQLPMYQLWFSS